MLGKRHRMEKKAGRGEASRAYATVLHVTKVLPGTGGNNANVGGGFRVKVLVEPELRDPFEAHVHVQTASMALMPHEGERIAVLYSGDSVVWDQATAKADFQQAAGAKLQLSDVERDRFRATLLRKLDELHAKGKIGDAEYVSRKAEIEADPDLNQSA